MTSKPKFRVGQVVWHDGKPYKIAAIRGSGVRFELGAGWRYDKDFWESLDDCRPLTASEIGPGWQRKGSPCPLTIAQLGVIRAVILVRHPNETPQLASAREQALGWLNAAMTIEFPRAPKP